MYIRNFFRWLFLAGVILAIADPCCGQDERASDDRIGEIPQGGLATLQKMVKPDLKLSGWRQVNWLTDVDEARRRAIADDKPLVIFSAADGNAIGRS